jgi:hypothetical protein
MNITVNRVSYEANVLATYLMNITVNRVRDSSGYKGERPDINSLYIPCPSILPAVLCLSLVSGGAMAIDGMMVRVDGD